MSAEPKTGSTVPGFRDGVETPHEPKIESAFNSDEIGQDTALEICDDGAAVAEQQATEADSLFDRIEAHTKYNITVSIRQLIGAGIILGLGIVILNQVFSMDMVTNTSGPFSISTVTSPLGAALGIMGLALFVGGARVIMNQMGGGGGRGGL